jgi:hypothetical protein
MQRLRSAGSGLAALALVATLLAADQVAPPGVGRFGPLSPADGATPATSPRPSGTGPHPSSPNGRGPTVAAAVHHDQSVALRAIAPLPPEPGFEDPDLEEPHPLPGRGGIAGSPGGLDPLLQAEPVSLAAVPAVVTSFEGLTNVNGAVPPDTNGDIGPNHYVQWVNLSFAIYDRDGTKLYGPAAGNTLWTGFGAPCATRNDGDPIVQYDHLADRWLMSQFALPNYPSGPFYQCLAVSATADPLGSWYRYAFQISATKLNDYPHFGVWPDAWYMSINQFSGTSWGGQGAVAFERTRMLQGLSAQMVSFDLLGVDPNLGGMLPSDLDGPAPPGGAPNVFVEADDDAFGYPDDQLQLWSFHVDWTTPASSTFSLTSTLPTAAFDSILCGGARDCLPQPGTPKGLDALADRIMYRLQYRNFGDHQALIVNHTVDVNGADRAGIRWYELRKTASSWSIHQQGTYSPDATNRWLGSAAMDDAGNLAIGYSAGSGSVYPSLRYTGRLAGDALGTLGLGEGTIIAGSGSQTTRFNRWGDYAMLAVDPSDDCTYWFTSEYVQTTGEVSWLTRIASFRMPGCGDADTTAPAVTSFAPTTSSPTNAATIAYSIAFSEDVVGLSASDFGRSGTATGCTIGAPTGSGSSYAVSVSGCSAGSLVLTLAADSVADASSNSGPAAGASAASVLIDRTAPTVSAPKVSLRSATTLSGSSLRAAASWTGSDIGGAGVASYDVAQSTDGGAFVVIGSALATTSLSLVLSPGHTYRYEVRPRDAASNLGAWLAGPTLRPLLVQQTSAAIHYTGTWTTTTSTVYSGGSARFASAAGASVSYTFSGRSVGAVLARGPYRGAVKVYVDGVLASTIDLYAATDTYRYVAFARTWTSVGTHTLKLVVVGTVGRPRVILDAIEVLQ